MDPGQDETCTLLEVATCWQYGVYFISETINQLDMQDDLKKKTD